MTELVSDEEATEDVKKIFAEIRDRLGMVPNFFRAQAVDSEWLRSNWKRWKRIMDEERAVDRKTKEMIALAVSFVNDCEYCKNAHEQMARAAGATDEELIELREVVELFESFNSIADSLDVPVEEDQ